jgi:very-short-patch-repair endonuclease
MPRQSRHLHRTAFGAVQVSNFKMMHRAGELRKEATSAETILWAQLRGNKINGVGFRRQHAIGKYVTDFCSPKTRLVIELDGSQHVEQANQDKERSEYLAAQGYQVIRFWNEDVINDIEGVNLAIQRVLEKGSRPRMRPRTPALHRTP